MILSKTPYLTKCTGRKAPENNRKAVSIGILFLLLLLNTPSLFALPPAWVSSYGMQVPYGGDFITGFGMNGRTASDSESIEAAKTQALDDLIRKIKVEISSSIVTRETDNQYTSSSSISIVSKSVSSLKLNKVDFLIEKDSANFYALAAASKKALFDDFSERAKTALQHIAEQKDRAEKTEGGGNTAAALHTYIEELPLFSDFYEAASVCSVLKPAAVTDPVQSFGVPGFASMNDVLRCEQGIKGKISDLKQTKENSLENALGKIAVILSEQGAEAGNMQVPALTFEDSDFSSSFGRYAGRKLDTELNEKLPKTSGKKVVLGSYWIKDDRIELLVTVKTIEGKTTGSASAAFPADAVPKGYDIKPQNFEQALIDRMQFEEDALVDGGINVEIWTNRGRNEDVLVFQKGEALTLYFKVNQPAYLQITYILATGEKVLLEEAFYIGMDKVNKVVRYHYDFEVTPPFGVERLIVNAFSTAPPKPNVVPKTIEGEQYEVFNDVKAVVAQTRGLKKKADSEAIRVGEAQLALTTVER